MLWYNKLEMKGKLHGCQFRTAICIIELFLDEHQARTIFHF